MNDLPATKAPSVESLVGRIADEFIERLHRGEQPDVEEYARRHPELADVLRQALAALEALEPQSATARGPEPGPADGPPADDLLGQPLGDFRLLREVGRGGMGVVFEAEQLSLGRRVALKVLPLAATLDPRQLQRFQNEARAAAGLHHTNIVPVYAVGSERGVHYYAMQFIDGQTLATLIAQRCQAPRTEAQPTAPHLPGAPAADTAERAAASTERPAGDAAHFRRVADWGVQAAEALDHAHQMGIVHRDVKPANLLVDAAGRLWVTDFGLAQVQSETRVTMTGDLVGTLRYMSPEQALARRVVIDHRTDVYSLGATLYELLTMRPAFDGADRQELLRQIAFEEPLTPRRLNRAIPAELETVVLKAMEKNPTERYGTARELADDLERFLKDEPIRARRPPLLVRLRKWGRRHRPVVASLAAVALTLLAVAAAWALAYQRRLTETERGVTAALLQAETLLEEGEKLLDYPDRWQVRARLAQAAIEKAEELLAAGAATEPLTRRLDKDRAAVAAAVADSGLLVEFNRIRLEQATGRKGPYRVGASASSYAQVLKDYGVDLAEPTSAGPRIRDSRLREPLLAALEDWWRVSDEDRVCWRLEQVLQVADPTDVSRAHWRDAVRQRDRVALRRMARELATQRLRAAVVCSRAADLMFVKEWMAAEQLLKAAQARGPADFWLNHDLGMVLQEQGPARAEEAVGYLRAALALRSDSPAVHVNLGLALEDKGDTEGAARCCWAALDIDPKFNYAHVNLGVLLTKKGDLNGAVKCYKRALEIDPRDSYAHNNLGYVLRAQGKVDEAIACFKRAIAIDSRYAGAHRNLAAALQSTGKFEEAFTCLKRLTEIDPQDANAHSDLGAILNDKRGDHTSAIAAFRTAIDLNPKHPLYRFNLGNAFRDNGQLDDAIAAYREGLRLNKDHPALQDKDHAGVQCELGRLLARQGRFAEAVVELKRGLELGSKIPGWTHPAAQWLRAAERRAAPRPAAANEAQP
jgi:serine/threonine protein kinase/Flp pilus assembly protein TadD